MYFIKEKISKTISVLKSAIYSETIEIGNILWQKGNYNQNLSEVDNNNWVEFIKGSKWGKPDNFYWFKLEITIPPNCERKPLIFSFNTGKEGEWDATNPQCLCYVNGVPVQGMDVNHTEVLLCESAKCGEKYEIILYAYAGKDGEELNFDSTFKSINRSVEKLYYDMKIPFDVACLLEEYDKNRVIIIQALDNTADLLDFRKLFFETFYSSVEKAEEYIQNEFYDKYCGRDDDISVIAVGHTHIDVAWLWSLNQTREKVVRSFTTVLKLMEEYPEYIFMSSQPQLYEFLKEDYPEVFAKVKERIQEGRWEVEGAMWLEADCNLSSGESLIRQILFGKKFMKEEFNVNSEILWLPDVFGYSAALPQILSKTGVKYFMTIKIGWNEYNTFPYDTFMWKGIDGSSVLTHFVTTSNYSSNNQRSTTYTGVMTVDEVMGTYKRYQNKDIGNNVLSLIGHGDGGGGTNREMIENARRMEKGIPGCPKVKWDKSLNFFKAIRNNVDKAKRVPKWSGELYFEYHRGTYTTMARNKKFNRKSEITYMDAEFLNSMTDSLLNKPYEQFEINKGWKTILLNQFHDIIPGSSIEKVYEDSKEQYEKILLAGKKMIQTSLMAISENIYLKEKSIVVFNTLSLQRTDIVRAKLPKDYNSVIVYDGEREIPSQIQQDGEQKYIYFIANNLPSKGYKAFTLREGFGRYKVSSTISEHDINNKFYYIKFNENMEITLFFDKRENREVLKYDSLGNEFVLFEDRPINWDAWDINYYYKDKPYKVTGIEKLQIVDNGPVFSRLRFKKSMGDSILEQEIWIYEDLDRIDFKTKVDWREDHMLLKVFFPIDVNANRANFEIQYGNVERPTHSNTSWDVAKFETCAHKWVDISEGDYGVSLLNDCKYGHSTNDNVLGLTLLKSSKFPNPVADMEEHEFTYSIYPHKGDYKQGKTINAAYNLNYPLYSVVEEPHKGKLNNEFSYLFLDKDNIIVEVVKKAENRDETVIRLYESTNIRTKLKLTYYREIKEAYESDFLENNETKLKTQGNTLELEFRPFEIKTIIFK